MHTRSLRTAVDLAPGDHLCCIYETEEEHRAVLTPFLRQGLERGEKVVYIVDARTAETVLGYLRDDGLAPEPYLERGQLTILTRDDAYMREGVFDPDGMIALLRTETEQALAEGYSALRITGEMTWALRGLPGSERLIEYEARLNEFFPGSRCLAICQYDRRRFDSEVLLDVLRTHPIAVIGTEVYDNFYYMSPAELLGSDVATAELRRWVQNLSKHNRLEEDRAKRIAELELMQRVHEALSRGASLEEMLRLVAKGAQSLFASHTATIYFLSDDQRHLLMQNWALPEAMTRQIEKLTGLNVREIPLPLVKGGHYWRTVHERRALLISDPQEIEELIAELATEHPALKKFVPAIARLLGYRSVLTAPLVAEGRVLGVMDLGSREQLDEEDRRRFERLAVQLSLAIERVRLLQDKQRLNQFNQLVLSSIKLGLLVLDTEGHILYLNDFIKDRYGWSDDLLGGDIFEYRPIYRKIGLYDAFRQIVETARPMVRQRVEHPDSHGRILICDFYGYPLLENGQVRGVVVLVEDLTEEEATRRRQEALWQALNRVGQAVQRATDQQRILDVVTRELQKLGLKAMFFMLDEAGVQLIPTRIPYDEALIKAGEELTGLPKSEYRLSVAESSLLTRLLSSKLPFYFKDGAALIAEVLPSALRPLAGQLAEIFQVRQVILAPLAVDDRVIGVLSVGGESLGEEDLPVLNAFARQVCLSLMRARLQERLQAIHALGRELVLAADEGHIARAVVETAKRVLKFQVCGLWLVDREKRQLVRRASTAAERVAHITALPLDSEQGITVAVARSGEPIYLPDVQQDSRYIDIGIGTRSELCVPLKVGEKIIGILNAESEKPDAFSEADRQLLSTLADQAAIAIENARLYEETRRRAERLAVVNRIARIASTTLHLDDLVEIVYQEIAQVFQADAFFIALYDPETNELDFHLRVDEGVREPPERRPLGTGLTAFVVTEKKPLLIRDFEKERDHLPPVKLWGTMKIPSSWLGVPMLSGDQVVGVISVQAYRPNAYGEEERLLLSTIADQVAVAVQRACLFQQVQESEARYRDLFENSPDMIHSLDAEGNFLAVNRTERETLGYSLEEMLQMNIRQVLAPEEVDRMLAALRHMIETREPITNFETVLLTRDGRRIPVEVNATAFFEDGRFTHTRAILRDISERRQMQERLLQAEKLAALGELISGVAHELNNPLTAVMGYAQLLQAAPVDEQMRADLQCIYEQAERASRIVQNLLDFARKRPPERKLVDLNELLERTLALRSYELRVENIQVITELDETLPRTLADPHQMQQVFMNIIVNAEQAMSEAHGWGILTVRSRALKDRIRVEIADDGPGIPAEIMSRIFDPFFTTKGQGTGLGLSICYGIVTGHGGQIWAESPNEKGGATFVIELPLVKEEEPEAEKLASPLSPVAAPPSRILVVDDEESVRALFRRLLRQEGHEVHLAASGVEALQALARASYDLIICDVKMPGMDGKALYYRVMELYPELAPRILFITGDVIATDTQQFLDETGNPYVSKPFEINQFLQVVQEALKIQKDE